MSDCPSSVEVQAAGEPIRVSRVLCERDGRHVAHQGTDEAGKVWVWSTLNGRLRVKPLEEIIDLFADIIEDATP